MSTLSNRAPAAPRAPALPSIAHLWALLPLTIVVALLSLAPTLPHDFWWHLRVGQIVAEHGVPRTNMFAWTLPADAPFVYAAWLADYLFYQAYAALGLGGPVLLRNMLGLAGFALVALEARRRSGSWRLAGLAVLLTGLMSINNLTTRPQNFVWPVFTVYALILGAYLTGQVGPRALLVLPPLMAFWVNAHGSFVLGLALVGITGAGELLRAILRQPEAMSWRRIGWLLLAGAACLAATALNPIGSDIFGYVVKLLTDPPSQGLVNEWQPPTTRSLAGAMFFAALVILLAALALGRRRPTLTETLLLCGFLWLALTGMRYVVWFGMLAMPILAQCLSRSPADIAHQRPADRSEGLFALILALALAGGVLILQPPLKAALPLPPAYKTFFAPVPGGAELFSLDTPAAAAAYLRANPAPGKLWNDMAYGSYLIWAAPEIQVFADPRVELFPLPQWQDYLAIAEARDYRRLLVDTYDVRRVLLDREVQPKLAAALAADPDWEREYSDARAEIYRRIR